MDEGYNFTHEELVKVEQRCVRMFRKTEQELKKTIDAYFADFADLDAERQQLVKEGKMTRNEYLTWRSVRIGQGKRFEALRDDIAKRLTNVHAVALEYINDTTPRIYALNRNFAAYEIEQGSGVAFNLVDEATVRELLTNEPDLMPEYNPYYPKSLGLQTPKDLEYGKRVITHEVTAGIMQGKSIDDIADSLQVSLVHMNRVSAVRAARTAVTAAQNGGRMATYKQAIEMGIPLQKEWMATLDSRTRDSHADLDGTIIDYDKPFSNGVMFPGDPSGKPAEIYNCRCCLKSKIKGHKYTQKRQTYKEWKAERDAAEKQQKNVDKSNENSYYMYNKGGDRLLKATGRIIDSDPEAYYRFVKEAKRCGVEVVESDGGIYYSPGIMPGRPGQIHISPNNSYGACLHEIIHMRKDMEHGWGGFKYCLNQDNHVDMEYYSYATEIKIARNIGRQDIADELIEDLKEEIEERMHKFDGILLARRIENAEQR